MAKKKRSGRKRTITPEHQAKMQEGRERARVHKMRVYELEKSGFGKDVPETKTERMLNSVRRR